MIALTDVMIQRRRPVMVGLYIITTLLILCFLAPVVQAYRPSVMANVQSYNNSEPVSSDGGPNAVADMMSQGIDNVGIFLHGAEVHMLSGIMSAATALTHFDKAVTRGPKVVGSAIVHGVGRGVVDTGHFLGSALAFTGRGIGHVFVLTGHGIWHAFGLVGHGIGSFFGSVGRITHLNSVVQPQDSTAVPVIELRQRQAAIIQKDTKSVSVTPSASGSGGACDSGDGNGGYPMVWCDTRMDSLATIYGSSDAVNRECTSYAYWYFTSVEGHADLHTSGDAKYWATSTNYPAHSTPAVGAIAVETAGTYGHVAIVQALPGQTYDGQIVPAGDVLVSEMNYDWQGHFRYSYSPMSKFTTYIYP